MLDGRFKARLVEGDEYLLKLSRYVHLNPVEIAVMKRRPIGERIEALRRYRWSSYPGYIGRCRAMDWVTTTPVLALMGGARGRRPAAYRRFVETGLAQEDPDFVEAMRESPLAIGTESFRVSVMELYQQKAGKRGQGEDVSFRRMVRPLETRRVLEVVAERLGVEQEELQRRRRNSPLRGVAARMLCRFSGLCQREVARVLGMSSGSAVSRQLTGLKQQVTQNKKLRKQVEACEKTLHGDQAKGQTS